MSYTSYTPMTGGLIPTPGPAPRGLVPLGMDADTVWKASQQALQVLLARQKLIAAWNAAGLSDSNLPVLFVIDMLRKVAEQMSAYRDMQSEMLRQDQYIFSADEIYNANRAAAQLWQGVYADVPPTAANPLGIPPDLGTKGLVGVYNAALEARDRGRAAMAVTVSNGKSLITNISDMLGALSAAYLELTKIDATRPWYTKLGGLSTGLIEAAAFCNRAIFGAKDAIAAGAAALYKPIGDAKDMLVALAKISAFGLLAYVVYKFKG